MNITDEAKLDSLIRSTFEARAVHRAVSCCCGELGPSINQCWLQPLQFSVHLIDLLSILLRYNGFTGIQKAVVDQTGSRPPKSDHELFSGANLALESALELLIGSAAELAIAGYSIKSLFITGHNLVEK